mmetsp:Transcript_58101/g.189184  ORF Transcript_58101/g.189184 Transcript_58101/m.189184 type:complete len:258 (+) Transcript_58101:1514-2287(+)
MLTKASLCDHVAKSCAPLLSALNRCAARWTRTRSAGHALSEISSFSEGRRFTKISTASLATVNLTMVCVSHSTCNTSTGSTTKARATLRHCPPCCKKVRRACWVRGRCASCNLANPTTARCTRSSSIPSVHRARRSSSTEGSCLGMISRAIGPSPASSMSRAVKSHIRSGYLPGNTVSSSQSENFAHTQLKPSSVKENPSSDLQTASAASSAANWTKTFKLCTGIDGCEQASFCTVPNRLQHTCNFCKVRPPNDNLC